MKPRALKAASFQAWQTPDSVFAPLDAEFGFVVDLAASAENAMCNRFLTEAQDAISLPWDYPGFGWLNCPYDSSNLFLHKALYEVREAKRLPGVVMLLPASVSTRWFRLAFREAEIQLYEGRIAFEAPEDRTNLKRPSFSNMLVIIRQDPDSLRGVTCMRSAKTGLITFDHAGGGLQCAS